MAAPRGPTAAAAPIVPAEDELAAATLSLLSQPSLWASLRFPDVTAADAAQGPWTLYWATRLDHTLRAAQGRQRFEAAHAEFTARDDRTGALLSLAAVIESYYVDETALDPLDDWVATLERSLPADGEPWPSPELEALVMACGVGITLRDQSHGLLARWAQRGATLLRQLRPGACRVKLATFLLQYHLWRGEFGRTSLIVDAMPGLDLTGLLPGESVVWLESVATHARFAGQPERGLQAVDAALAICRAHALSEHLYALHAHGASLALAAHDVGAATAHLAGMRPVLDTATQDDQTHYWHYSAGLRLLQSDAMGAVELARAALQNSAEIGGAYRAALHRLSLGQALLEAGESAEAQATLAQAEAAARQIDAGLIAFTAALTRSAALHHLGQTGDAAAALQQALAEGARRDFRTTAGWWQPAVVAERLGAALAQGIEPAYARRLAGQRALPGPNATLAEWPWPLRLQAFGPFEAMRGEHSLTRGAAKGAQRPLDLLRALLAQGPGPLPVGTVLEWLWPDAEAPAQRKAFDVALLRLRRLLDDARLVHLDSGRLWLDTDWVYTDVHALHALMQQVGSAYGATLAQLQAWGRQLLELMRGPFLADDESPWVLGARERYRQRFVVTIAQIAGQMEALDVAAAVQLYQRALDAEPLAESIVRRLMRLHADRGDRAEALRVWRGACTMLTMSAGLSPSRETQALAVSLGLVSSAAPGHRP